MDRIRADDSYQRQREQVWLRAIESPELGLNQTQLGALVGLTQSQISRRLARARADRPEREPIELIEVMAMTPRNGCSRHHEMRVGERKICLNCGMSAPFKPGAPIVDIVDPKRKFIPKRPRRKKSAHSSLVPESG